MRALILIPILLTLKITICAQDSNNVVSLFEKGDFKEGSNELLFVVREPVAEVFDQVSWQSGVLIDYKNDAYKVKSYYNSKTDEMQILLKDEPKTIFPQKITAIKIGEMIFIPANFSSREGTAYGYFQVLSENKIKLLQRFETVGTKIKKTFYTCRKDEIASPLKLNRNCILKTINDKETSLHLKNSELDVKNVKDLIHIFDFYNGKL